MLSYYLKTYFKNIKRNKLFSIANIICLSIGLSVGLAAFLLISFHLSFDRDYKDADRIYRIVKSPNKADKNSYASLQVDLAERIKTELPEIEQSTPVSAFSSVKISTDRDNNSFRAVASIGTDENFFSIFGTAFLAGSQNQCLSAPNSVVITQSLADKLFPGQNPVGKIVYRKNIFRGNDRIYELLVTAEIKDFPVNSFLSNNMLIINYKSVFGEMLLQIQKDMDYGDNLLPINGCEAYVKLNKAVNLNEFNTKITGFINRNTYHYNENNDTKYSLQNLEEIHLNSDDIKEGMLNNHESMKTILIFAGIGSLFLLGAFLNYFGYTLISFNKRIKELGVYKFLGADKLNFSLIFFTESFITLLISSLLSLMFIETWANSIVYRIAGRGNLLVYPGHALSSTFLFYFIVILVSIIPVLYLTFITSKIQTSNMILNKIMKFSFGRKLWSGLIIVQTAIPVFLVACSLVINNQITFLKGLDPGYTRDNVLQFSGNINSSNLSDNSMNKVAGRCRIMESELNKFSSIQSITRTNFVPGFTPANMFNSRKIGDNYYQYSIAYADLNYFNTFNIKFIKSVDFSKLSFDAFHYIVLTENTAKEFGIDYMNKPLPIQFEDFIIVGIVNNIYFGSFRGHKMGMMFELCGDEMNQGGIVAVKIRPGQEADVKKLVVAKWKELTGDENILLAGNTIFDSADFNDDESFLSFITVFSILTLFMAIFSIFSTTAFNTAQRTKELGIRKIVGAPFYSLLWLIIKDIVFVITASVVVASPFVYMVMQKWLMDFTYKINIGIATFLITGCITLLVAATTVSYITVKASRINPVESLRYE